MRIALVLLAGSMCGCYGIAEFRPKNPTQSYEPLVRTASRLPNPSSIVDCGANEIGVIHADGSPAEVVGAIAEEAADQGGTHYVLRGDSTESSDVYEGTGTTFGNTTFVHGRRTTEKTRYTWAVVYRVPRNEWFCAGFHPHER